MDNVLRAASREGARVGPALRGQTTNTHECVKNCLARDRQRELALYEGEPIGYSTAMHIDDLMGRIRRLPAAKRKELDEIVRSLEQNLLAAVHANVGQSTTSAALRPVRGLLQDLGPAPSNEAIE